MRFLSFNKVSLNIAGKQILDKSHWHIHSNDKIALVGRNGAGKSTILKLLQGELLPDSGEVHRKSGMRIASLIQEVPTTDQETVYEFIVRHLGDKGQVLSELEQASKSNNSAWLMRCQEQMDALHAWTLLPVIDTMVSRLGLDKQAFVNKLSGGMKRRALLAAALASSPDLLLLDEPTNHIDLNTIEWLESYLKSFSGCLILVTHDRQFLSQVCNQIVALDRGFLHQFVCNYETYLDRREAMRQSEQSQQSLFDKRLQQEEAWLRQGVKARRTRNEGRVKELKAMRETYARRREVIGKMKTVEIGTKRSGQLVIDAKDIDYLSHGRVLLQSFSMLLTRGAKVGIIGPNGCGKTTLVRLLIGELQPTKGIVRHGTTLDIGYFDQLRRQLDEQKSVMDNIADGAEFVTVNGQQKHVASYLKSCLFHSDYFLKPVSSLSGGEKNRLLLAKLFAKPVNLLVLDEPTNDLDIETLEWLEEMLLDYKGTLLLISHDRTFINNIVTSILIYEGMGQFNEYVGGYNDYYGQRQDTKPIHAKPVHKILRKKNKLSYHEQRELDNLPSQIEKVEQRISEFQQEITNKNFYKQEQDVIAQTLQSLENEEKKLSELFARWEFLENI